MVVFIIFALATVAAGVYSFLEVKKIVSSEMIDFDFKGIFTKTLLKNVPFTVAFTMMLVGGMLWANYPADALHCFKLIAGGLLFSFSLIVGIQLFIFYYWGKNIDEKWKKITFWSYVGGFIIAILTLFLWLDGYAPYIEYPVVKGISFTDGFVTPKTGKPNIAWYALCILGGAILVYFVCDHLLYKEYGKHGIAESTFYVAFPAGIIGARIFFCIGEGLPLDRWIRIWDGGITVVAGALAGIVVGVLWFMWRNKKYSIFVAVDCIVPTILIAQTIGRWGNFFNCEVHGLEVSVEYFKWLPEIVLNNLSYSQVAGQASPGMIYLPLFLIEGIINLVGYFVLAHLFGKKLSNILEPGDLGIAYIIWYGMTRVLLEPLRHPAYNMGKDGYWSWFWSLIFVLGGTIGIIVNHIIRYKLKKRNNTYIVQKNDMKLGLIETGTFGVVGIGLLVTGIILMAGNEYLGKIGFDPFNVGLMLLIVGFSVLLYAIPSTIRFYEAKRKAMNA